MSYTDEFRVRTAEGGGWMKPRDLLGHRIAVTKVHSINEEADPMNAGRMRDVATVDWVDLDDDAGSPLHLKGKVDKPGIINKLSVGSKDIVIGRMGQGDAKPGQNPPFILESSPPEDIQYFSQTWLPSHIDELRSASGTSGPPAPAPAPAPAAQQPSVATGQQTFASTASAPAAPSTLVSAAGPASGIGEGNLSPEAQAALAGMIARGEIPGFGGTP